MILLIIGVGVLVFIFYDLFLTIFSLRGGGPATNLIGAGLWRGLLCIHRKHSIHKLLGIAGPLILIIILLFWYFLTALAWLLIFFSKESSVVDSHTKVSSTFLDKLYFTGTTVSDLGYGDLVPQAFPWTVLSSFAALTATLIISAALSYVLPVIAAGLEKRTIAKSIHGFGESCEEMIRIIGIGGGREVSACLVSAVNQLQDFTLKHLSYPILLYFHSPAVDQSLSVSVLKLADVLFLMEKGAHPREFPLGGFYAVAEGTIQGYSQLDHVGASAFEEPSVPRHLSLETLEKLGVPTVDAQTFATALAEYQPLRARLSALCACDGWPLYNSEDA